VDPDHQSEDQAEIEAPALSAFPPSLHLRRQCQVPDRHAFDAVEHLHDLP
jgi:hypothetical protein